jgi:hypothetical protein
MLDTQDYLEVCWKALVRDDVIDHNKYNQTILVLGADPEHTIRFLRRYGYGNVASMVYDDAHKHITQLPFPEQSVDTIVVQYVPGITNAADRKQFVDECKRIARGGCMLMLDLQTAGIPADHKGLKIQAEFIERFDWTVLDNRKARCLLRQ